MVSTSDGLTPEERAALVHEYEDTDVWFHYHAESDPCTDECYAVPKNPAPPRLERMAHTHVFQGEHEHQYPECPACRSINSANMRPTVELYMEAKKYEMERKRNGS